MVRRIMQRGRHQPRQNSRRWPGRYLLHSRCEGARRRCVGRAPGRQRRCEALSKQLDLELEGREIRPHEHDLALVVVAKTSAHDVGGEDMARPDPGGWLDLCLPPPDPVVAHMHSVGAVGVRGHHAERHDPLGGGIGRCRGVPDRQCAGKHVAHLEAVVGPCRVEPMNVRGVGGEHRPTPSRFRVGSGRGEAGPRPDSGAAGLWVVALHRRPQAPAGQRRSVAAIQPRSGVVHSLPHR